MELFMPTTRRALLTGVSAAAMLAVLGTPVLAQRRECPPHLWVLYGTKDDRRVFKCMRCGLFRLG